MLLNCILTENFTMYETSQMDIPSGMRGAAASKSQNSACERLSVNPSSEA